MSAPTHKERSALALFRKAIQTANIKLNERQSTDMALMSWLRGNHKIGRFFDYRNGNWWNALPRELNISKSLDMLQKSLAWKKEYDWDNLLTWKPPENYERDYPYEICGRCFDESPVFIFPFGKYDIRKAVEAGEKDVQARHFHQRFAIAYEELDKINRECDPSKFPVSQVVIIHDFKGFSWRQMRSSATVQSIMECNRKFEANYPELVKALYVINAPKIFSILFAMLRPLMSARTLAKLHIFDSDDKKWKPALLEHIASYELPIRLGGTKPDAPEFAGDKTTLSEKDDLLQNGNGDVSHWETEKVSS